VTSPTPTFPDLFRFIDANVESLDQLEILRVIGESPDKQWSAVELAKESQVRSAAIAGHLAALESRGLVKTTTQEAQLVCVYAPRTPELQNMLSQMLQLYRERPVTLIRMVSSRADERLKAFADAFRLGKEH
jgi:DNA-binding MarR family transcriptional regulator